MLAQIMTFCPIFSPSFLRSSSVQLFVSSLYTQVPLCPGRCLAFESFLAYLYVKYIVSLVKSYAITHLPR